MTIISSAWNWQGVVAAGMLAVLTACAGDMSQNFPLGNYQITVATDPSPPRVGEDAEVTAQFKNPDSSLDACQMQFRQFMPEHEMSADETWHDMKRIGKDQFRARGSEFHMGGDWELEFKLSCGADTRLVSVPYMLEWPE